MYRSRVSTTVTGECKWGQELGVISEEVKGYRAVGLVKIPFSLLQGYYVMAYGNRLGSRLTVVCGGRRMIYAFCFMPGVYSRPFLRNQDAKEVPGGQEGSHVRGRIYMCFWERASLWKRSSRITTSEIPGQKGFLFV